MAVVLRVAAFLLLGGALTGCQTDGLIGPDGELSAAKPRVVDTPKTATRASTRKKAIAKRTEVAQGDASEPDAGDDGSITGSVPAAEDKAETQASHAGANVIPAQSLFGNWTLVDDGSGGKCRVVLGGVLIGAAYSARSGADCPQAFAHVQSWEIQGDELVLRNQSRGVVGRLQPTGPFRFDGEAAGAPVHLIR